MFLRGKVETVLRSSALRTCRCTPKRAPCAVLRPSGCREPVRLFTSAGSKRQSSLASASGLKIYAAQSSTSSLVNRALQTCGRIGRWVARLAAITLLLAAALPTILSTNIGLQAGTSLASHFVDGDIHIDKAELAWLKPIHLHGVKYSLPAALGGDPLATAKSLGTRSRLWDVIVGRKYDVYGEKPWLDCTFSQSGQWKWTQLANYAAGKPALPVSSSSKDGSQASVQPSTLVQDTTEINFSAEARLLTASVFFPKGTMKVPNEIKEVIGEDLHLVAVLGRSCLEDAAKEFDFDVSWAQPKDIQELSRADSDASSFKSATSSIASDDESEENFSTSRPHSSLFDGGNKAKGTVAASPSLADRHSESSAASASWFGWESLDPGVVEIRSENLNVNANGWRRRADGAYLLNKPGRLEFAYTPALAQYVLGRLSPLLSGVLAVDNGVVGIDVTPKDLMSPAESYHFRIDPLRVALQRQGMLKTAIEFLRLSKNSVDSAPLLQGATSAIHVDVGDDGSVATQRLDLLVSPGGKSKGVQLCSWGSIKPTQDKIDLNLGIPASTLSYMGMTSAKQTDVLVIPLKGTFSRPTVDWRGAYSRLSTLAASRAKEPTSIRGAILQGIARGFDMQLSDPETEIPEVPQPSEPLPWELNSKILEQKHINAD